MILNLSIGTVLAVEAVFFTYLLGRDFKEVSPVWAVAFAILTLADAAAAYLLLSAAH